MTLLAIDPGARTGWAKFVEGQLHECGVISPFEHFAPWATIVVIENPVIYPNGKARPNDILKLARIAGRYEERFRGSRIELVEPREWKGTINGDIMCKRIEKDLTPEQRAVYDAYTGGYRHNALDAIGLGLWSLRQPFARGR